MHACRVEVTASALFLCHCAMLPPQKPLLLLLLVLCCKRMH
jgi:hypothetical protein